MNRLDESEEPKYVQLDGKRIGALLAEKHRTGAGPGAILAGTADKPDGLSAEIVNAWLDGGVPAARADHYKYVLQRWSRCGRMIPLDDERRRALLAEKQRTGIGSQKLLRGAHGKPDGLTAAVVNHWLAGAVTARQEYPCAVADARAVGGADS